MAIVENPDRSKQALALIANLNAAQFASLEEALAEISSDAEAGVRASLLEEHQLTPEEGRILLEAAESPPRDPSPRMLEAIANYKRIMSETLGG